MRATKGHEHETGNIVGHGDDEDDDDNSKR
jgi:hypothetical protein